VVKDILAKRYSKVLIECYKKKELDQLQETIQSLQGLLDSHSEIKEFFTSPAVDRKHKFEVLELMVKESGLEQKMHNFFKLLIENNRIFFLDQIFSEITNAINKAKNINFFKLETARELNKKTINAIKKFVQNYVTGTVELEHTINKKLVGGFFVYNEDLALNASIKDNFETFVKEL